MKNNKDFVTKRIESNLGNQSKNEQANSKGKPEVLISGYGSFSARLFEAISRSMKEDGKDD